MGLENILVLAKGAEGGGGKDWDFGINRCKLVCIECMKMNRVVPYSIGSYIQYPVISHLLLLSQQGKSNSLPPHRL